LYLRIEFEVFWRDGIVDAVDAVWAGDPVRSGVVPFGETRAGRRDLLRWRGGYLERQRRSGSFEREWAYRPVILPNHDPSSAYDLSDELVEQQLVF
jgi:hypothetical protein